MRMKCAPTLAIILCSLAISLPVSGQTVKIETIDGPPWGFLGTDGKPTGMMFEISNRIAQEAGLHYTNDLVPYARTAADIEYGTADFVLRFSNDQLLRGALQLATITSMPIIAVGPAGTRYKSLDDLHGKTVGIVRAGRYDDKFDNDSAIKKYDAKDYVQIVRMLVKNRLDAGVGSSVGLYYSAHVAGIRPQELGEPLVLGSRDFILHFSRKNANSETSKALKEAVDKLAKSGEIKKIIRKYLGDYSSDAESLSR